MVITMNIFTAGADEQGHTLVKLWRNYEKAVSDDRPKDQLAILEDIKEEAAEQHLIWDFCDAARKYADVRSSMNWKLRDSLETSLDEELEAFGEPAAFIFAGSRCRNADSLPQRRLARRIYTRKRGKARGLVQQHTVFQGQQTCRRPFRRDTAGTRRE